ncbi:MAG: hypothetical protein OXQ89_18665 [Rhodospirillaceae bacterium]|nr:hypothetical protein [Rhodospirillaceae bacterium]
MKNSQLTSKDPRTVARNIPGIFDVIFPQFTPGIVIYLNKRIKSSVGIDSTTLEMVNRSVLNRAMLFEVAFARGEQLLSGKASAEWDECLQVATQRQRLHFDASPPESLTDADMAIADFVGHNLAHMLGEIQTENGTAELVHSPRIPGYQWIQSSEGDFSIGTTLIEVKCTSKKFGSADYRQVLMYWLLSYASSIENRYSEWTNCILINPRLNHIVKFSFDEIINFISAGRSKVEVLELFSFVVGDYGLKLMSDSSLNHPDFSRGSVF